MVDDRRVRMLDRLFEERSEWAVNASEQVLLALPHALREPPEALRIVEGQAFVEFEGGTAVPVRPPLVVAPFLARASTILVVTMKGTSIVAETDVFVLRDRMESGPRHGA